ncbi:MAG TPA: phosphoribosylanthranilate isomerase [Pyrinomonadaceae bacterium]|nr:phosphoribosylanthranilate isomerase [Pyrinomonadaceae bacterium]
MTKVKICGITNLEDALLSAKFGADALGFNFYPKSSRYILPEKAREIIDELPENVLKVGVFVDEDFEKTIEIAETAKLDAIQLHGEETPEFARRLKAKTNLEIIKAFRVSTEFKPEDVLQYAVDAVLLDAYNPKEHGGTGETFDWEIAKKVRDIFPKMYLAGGLSQDNIARAISKTKPFAVDACSCLENEKGKKDKSSLINFISNVLFSKRNTQEVEDLLYLLRLFRYAPNIYLPQKSITQICIYIFGYLTALFKSKSEYENTDEFLKRFDKYENIERGMFSHGIYAYAEHFLNKSNNDEEKAFDLFYAKLEEFLLETRAK